MALRQILLLISKQATILPSARILSVSRCRRRRHAAYQRFAAPPGFSAPSRIPGPLRSFARMAALSPDLAPEQLLPALARNVVTNGYQAISSNESLEQTEYLRLVVRYLTQARELAAMAGTAHKIVIPTCDSEQTGDLLKTLGYRMRGSCGGDVVLETVNPTRAFLTVDSAFRSRSSNRTLRANRRFELRLRSDRDSRTLWTRLLAELARQQREPP